MNMYNYLEEIEVLFEAWKNKNNHQNKVFNFDGIVNPDVWFNNSNLDRKKILFILKEAYHDVNFTKDSFSLTDYLQNNKFEANTFIRVAEWAWGIINTSKNEFPEYKKLSNEEINETLNKIAVINIKKSDGQPNSEKENLLQYAREDKELLAKQIDIINPDIIICGNTGSLLNEVFDKKIMKNCIGLWSYEYAGKIIIDYYHPSNRYPAVLNYYGLIATFQKALNKIK